MTIEDLLEETGGLGRFQIALISFLFFNKFISGWSMFQMAYAGLIPDWACLVENTTEKDTTVRYYQSEITESKQCQVNISDGERYRDVSCSFYNFSSEYSTIINEWDLVCDLKWVKQTVTSVQMAGLLVGALVAGQLGDLMGRKKTLYIFVLEHSLSNIVTAFSVSWQMFAVCRFFIGLGIGGMLVAVFPYPMEFLQTKWRPILAVIPVWGAGVSVFALTAWQLNNWWKLHLLCGACGLPGLFGIFWVPESLRWLTVKGRINEAEEIVKRMATINGKALPTDTRKILEVVERKERKIRESSEKYTYLDLFKEGRTAGITFIFCFQWFSFSLAYYGISFGLSSLAGNIFLNIFLLAILEVPPQIASFYFNNTIGRKWTAFALIFIACAAAWASFACDISDQSGRVITGLSLASKMGIGAAWAVMQTWGTEIYPTVTRNLGYGAANTAARVGGIAAPFIINFDDFMVASYVVIACLLVVCLILMLLTPETKDTVLADSLTPSHILESSSSSSSASAVGDSVEGHCKVTSGINNADTYPQNQNDSQNRNKISGLKSDVVKDTRTNISIGRSEKDLGSVAPENSPAGSVEVVDEIYPNLNEKETVHPNYGSTIAVDRSGKAAGQENKDIIKVTILKTGNGKEGSAGYDNKAIAHDERVHVPDKLKNQNIETLPFTDNGLKTDAGKDESVHFTRL